MKTRVFISRQNEGWSEVAIPEKYARFNYDRLVSCVHRLVHENNYKGLLITENPDPFKDQKL